MSYVSRKNISIRFIETKPIRRSNLERNQARVRSSWRDSTVYGTFIMVYMHVLHDLTMTLDLDEDSTIRKCMILGAFDRDSMTGKF